jgi:site-specific DNA-methyltransferase (cytosine-N4-specific)
VTGTWPHQPPPLEDYLYRQVGPVALYLGRAFDVIAAMPPSSVDCVVTSPPYWQLRDYGTGRWEGGDWRCGHEGARPRLDGVAQFPGRCVRCGARWEDPQYGLETELDTYIAVLVYTLGLLRRVLRPDGTLWLNLGDRYTTTHGTARAATILPHIGDAERPAALPAKQLLGIPWRVALALQAEGWWLRNAVTWTKTNPLPESVTDRLSTSYEMVFLLTRSPRYHFDLDPIRTPPKHPDPADRSRISSGANNGHHDGIGSSRRRRGGRYGGEAKYAQNAHDPRMRAHRGNLAATGTAHTAGHHKGRNPGDSWTLPTRPYPGAHTAPFPIDLPLRAIAAGCRPGGHVLDPFSGSGTTGLAALQLGRAFSGIDLHPAFHDQALTRLTPHLPPPTTEGDPS